MAGSSEYGKLFTILAVKKLFEEGLIRRVLDIGAGSGTYSELLRGHTPDAEWHGVEVWEPYLAEYDLHSKYDVIHRADARKLDYGSLIPGGEPGPGFDLTLCGDVLEHMEKEDAQILISKLLENSRMILISIPIIHYPQGEVHGNPYEAHVKDDWSHEEVIASFPSIQTFFIHNYIGLYMLSAAADLSLPLARLNAGIGGIIKAKVPEEHVVAWGAFQ